MPNRICKMNFTEHIMTVEGGYYLDSLLENDAISVTKPRKFKNIKRHNIGKKRLRLEEETLKDMQGFAKTLGIPMNHLIGDIIYSYLMNYRGDEHLERYMPLRRDEEFIVNNDIKMADIVLYPSIPHMQGKDDFEYTLMVLDWWSQLISCAKSSTRAYSAIIRHWYAHQIAGTDEEHIAYKLDFKVYACNEPQNRCDAYNKMIFESIEKTYMPEIKSRTYPDYKSLFLAVGAL